MSELKHFKKRYKAFTLAEIIVVVIIIAIAAFLAVPMFSSAADIQLKTAANLIAADIEYAKNLAITTQQRHAVLFNTDTESYQVQDSSDTVINSPLKSGSSLVVSFVGDSRVNKVDIASADFDGNIIKAVSFDYMGSPYSGLTTNPANSLVNGVITLQAGSMTMTVTIEPVTGYVSITGL